MSENELEKEIFDTLSSVSDLESRTSVYGDQKDKNSKVVDF